MANRRFEGQCAVVTGAAAGIGLACVERLASEGATVVLTDWHASRGSKAADELSARGLPVEFVHHDAGDEGSWRSLADHVATRHGLMHVLINNAYSGAAATFDTITPALFQDAMRVNAAGALLGMQLAAGLMREGGSIVNVASIAAFYPSQSNLGYAASKMAVIQLSASAAMALGQRKPPVRVNTVAPGAIDTHTLRTAIRALRKVDTQQDVSEGFERLASEAILRRVGRVEEVASAICFLASEEASYITGQCLRVDGGVF